MQIPKFKKVRLFPRYKDEEIPEDWEINTVGSLLKIIDYRGRTPPFSDEGILHLRSNNIRNGMINFDDVTFVSSKTYDEYMTRGIPQENDVLFTTEGPLGEVALVPKDFKFSLAQRIIVLRPKNSKLSSKFLKYLLLDRKVRRRYQGLSTGTTLEGIASKWFTKILLPYPIKFSEQEKIGSILSNVDSLIESYDEIIELARKFKRGITQQLLKRGIGHDKFKKVKWHFNKEIEIPKSWNMMTYEEISKKITYGFTSPMPETNDGPWMITATNIKNGKINYNSARKTSKLAFEKLTEKCKPKKGTVLITKDGTLGEVAIVEKDDELCINQSIASIEPKTTKVSSEYLSISLQSQFVKLLIEVFSPQTTIRHIYISDIPNWKIPYPSLPEQNKIAEILSTVDSKLSYFETKKSQIQNIKNGLQQELLAGQIRVKV